MQKAIFVSVLVLSLVVMETMCSENMLTPPERPEEFKNPNELRKYLKALNEYYAIVGRPRFGKRNGASRMSDLFRQNGDDFSDYSANWADI